MDIYRYEIYIYISVEAPGRSRHSRRATGAGSGCAIVDGQIHKGFGAGCDIVACRLQDVELKQDGAVARVCHQRGLC